MEIGLNLSLRVPLRFPVRVRILHDLPKIIAGGIPVTPINLAFKQRQRETGATQVSLETYARAARLYVEFCAHRGQTLLGISNEEFHWFKQALLGHPFLSAAGTSVTLSGERKERTADLMIVLLYSLATDIAERYVTAQRGSKRVWKREVWNLLFTLRFIPPGKTLPGGMNLAQQLGPELRLPSSSASPPPPHASSCLKA